MSVPQIVIDTSAFISALLSQKGAAYKMLMLLEERKFEINLSVPLIVEYEAVAKRILPQSPLSESDLDDVLNYLCLVGNNRKVYFLWRPFLRDPADDMVLELAVTASSKYIVTFNQRHFVGCDQFGIEVITPKEFLYRIGELA